MCRFVLLHARELKGTLPSSKCVCSGGLSLCLTGVCLCTPTIPTMQSMKNSGYQASSTNLRLVHANRCTGVEKIIPDTGALLLLLSCRFATWMHAPACPCTIAREAPCLARRRRNERPLRRPRLPTSGVLAVDLI